MGDSGEPSATGRGTEVNSLPTPFSTLVAMYEFWRFSPCWQVPTIFVASYKPNGEEWDVLGRGF